MATLVLGAIGTALGGPLGGAIGTLLGRQVDSAIFGSGRVRGPRLKDLEITTSSYGTAIPRQFGRMRVPGTIIWGTDLVEHADKSGGKRGPSVTSYTYSVSMAVAVSSRPIQRVGRVWADGKLLRGSDGQLKVGGTMRTYLGEDDQALDPLLLSADGAERCPAYRGIAYVVFEDLDLADYYNHIPSLTFEVFADDTFELADVATEALDETEAEISLPDLAGLTCEGPLAQTLEVLGAAVPFEVDAANETLVIRSEPDARPLVFLPEASVAVDDDEFGGNSGFARRRLPTREDDPTALRYYDLDRDYLPGLQRAAARTGLERPVTLEFPGAMDATSARALIERIANRIDWSRDRVSWRTCELSPDLGPGRSVALPDIAGIWRIDAWEWRATGIELSLSRRVPTGADVTTGGAIDPGRVAPQPDLAPAPTSLLAFELPWDGSGSGDEDKSFAAASSPLANWTGAALYADDGGGALRPLGPSGRVRAVIGLSVTALPGSNPLLIDHASRFEVDLLAPDFLLVPATASQLAAGANLALVGTELVQFANAEPLGSGRWRLSGFLRGRGGTEA